MNIHLWANLLLKGPMENKTEKKNTKKTIEEENETKKKNSKNVVTPTHPVITLYLGNKNVKMIVILLLPSPPLLRYTTLFAAVLPHSSHRSLRIARALEMTNSSRTNTNNAHTKHQNRNIFIIHIVPNTRIRRDNLCVVTHNCYWPASPWTWP